MDLESLSYGLQKNILEKHSMNVATKILCDTNPGLKFPADDRNDNVYVDEEVIVIGANEIKRPFNDSSQYFFTNVDYLIGAELTDELWLQLIKYTKGCSWLEIDYPVRRICSTEIFARFVKETRLSNLVWNRPFSELVPYDTRELERQMQSSKISTKKEFRNFTEDFRKEEVEEALLTFGDACQTADPNDYEFVEETLCCRKIYGKSMDDPLILVSFRTSINENEGEPSYITIEPFV